MLKTSEILNGTQIAKKYLEAAKKELKNLQNEKDMTPLLATIQVGSSADTEVYSKYLSGLLERVGIEHRAIKLSNNTEESKLIHEIERLNRDASVTGIMIFAPLPKSIDPLRVMDALDPRKDVEGRTFLKSHLGVFSPTANAVLTLIEATGIDLKGKEAVVVGHSDLVGKPAAVLLLDLHATVTVCHKETKNLEQKVRNADVVVAAVGKPNVIKGDWIKSGAVVIDVGENMLDGKLVGDVEFESAREKAAFISPVPGGVGPVTNVMLIKNLIALCRLNGQRKG